MDFFGAQEQARRQTRRLEYLFLLAVIGVITAVYLAVTMIFAASGEAGEMSLWNRDLFLMISVVTTLFIAGGSLYKISALASGGGEVVAESLGGRRVMRGSEDPQEQRLLAHAERAQALARSACAAALSVGVRRARAAARCWPTIATVASRSASA